MADEKRYFDEWLQREADLKEHIREYLEYDEIDAYIDLLASTVISDVKEYLENEYEASFREGAEGLAEPSESEKIQMVYAEIDGKDFEDRIQEYIEEAAAEDEFDADGLESKIDLLIATDGHRVRAGARYDAGMELASVGYTVCKTWRTMLDDRVRDTHWPLEGKKIPIDAYFETVNGRALFPGGFGVPEEDCNCRCVAVLEVEA